MAGRKHADARMVFARNTLAVAVSGVLTGNALAADSDLLEEVIVTARKRSENLQDIPASVQAISELELQRADVDGIDDYVRMIPSMSYVTFGPGTSKIVFRGVADSSVSFIADSSAAMYLDEQPLTQNSQNPEVRMIDIARVEALSGPQGTLYGSSSQSGTLRIITNPPDPRTFEANVTGSMNSGPDSEMSYELSGVLNLPLKDDKLALRLVGFDARDGGFIDNVLGTSAGGTFTNADVAKDNFNRADYQGGRATLLWNVNDAWQITTGAVFQDTDSDSEQSYDAEVGDLEVVRFHDEPRHDEWKQYHVTVQGDLGFADLISATSYFQRDIQYTLDTTAYNFYLHKITPYYPQYDFGPDPSGFAFQDQHTDRISQELRLSHEGKRIQWITGLFYERFHDQWDYNVNINNYESTPSFAYWESLYDDVGPGSTGGISYNANNKTTTTQYALFGEVSFDFNEKWSMTTGGRWFDTERDRTYFQEIPNNHVAVLEHPVATLRDFTPKLSFRYRFDDERMMYALYSQGFRNGGANILRPHSLLPKTYGPDFLDNYEMGLKSRWADGRVQVNATAYHMVWKDYQVEVVDPGPLYAVGVENVGNAEINGLEIESEVAVNERLEVGANVSFLRSAATSTDHLVGTPDGARLPNTPEFKTSAYVEYTWPMAALNGSAYVHVEYSYQGDSFNDIETNLGSTKYLCQRNLGPCPPLRQAPSQVTDFSFGIESGTWDMAFTVDNVFDERSQIYRTFTAAHPLSDFGVDCRLSADPCSVTVSRPLEFGLSFTKRWSGNGKKH